MRWLLNCSLCTVLLLTANAVPLAAAPTVKLVPISVPTAIPDYGARSAPGIPLSDAADAPNPLAQAGRTVAALIFVLGGVYGVVYLLKRAGYSGKGPALPALLAGLRRPSPIISAPPSVGARSASLTLVQSQILPGGGAVHLLSVNESTLLMVASTGQSISKLAEWEWEEDVPMVQNKPIPHPPFREYLNRADMGPAFPPLGPRTSAERLSDLLAGTKTLGREEARR